MKVFADTNFLVSAFATRGLSPEVFELILAKHELMTGEFVLSELELILSEKFKLPNEIIADTMRLLERHHVEPMPTAPSKTHVPDEDDRWVLASALNARADVLITGDNDLLDIADKVKQQKIITPRQFWELTQQ